MVTNKTVFRLVRAAMWIGWAIGMAVTVYGAFVVVNFFVMLVGGAALAAAILLGEVMRWL